MNSTSRSSTKKNTVGSRKKKRPMFSHSLPSSKKPPIRASTSSSHFARYAPAQNLFRQEPTQTIVLDVVITSLAQRPVVCLVMKAQQAADLISKLSQKKIETFSLQMTGIGSSNATFQELMAGLLPHTVPIVETPPCSTITTQDSNLQGFLQSRMNKVEESLLLLVNNFERLVRESMKTAGYTSPASGFNTGV